MTHYEVMGIKPTATQAEIKEQYRHLARLYHPDKDPGNKVAERKFKELTEANEVLSHPKKRAAYDRELLAGMQEQVQEASAEVAGPDVQKAVSIGGETGAFIGQQLQRTRFGQRLEAGAKVIGAKDLPSALAETGRRFGLGIAELMKKKPEEPT
jgi:curved DNA-binding protein